MNPLDIYWLEECCKKSDRYRVDVDNDCVFVTDTMKDKCVFEFSGYGWRFVIDLLRYIGCNAEEV